MRRNRLADDDGFSIVEMTASLTIIAVGFLALAGAGSTGARLLAGSRQRQAASEIANRQLEHIRNIPFDQVALTVNLTPSSDPENPDYDVSPDGTGYDPEGDATYEDLVVASDGDVPHTEDVTVGSTDLTSYQYVSWVDDPDVTGSHDYKRLTISVLYRAPVSTGRPTTVQVTALLTSGTVVVAGSASNPTEGSVPVPSASAPGAPGGSCTGDVSGPTGDFTIQSGTGADVGFTASQTIAIQVTPSDACTPITFTFSNDNIAYGTTNTYSATNPTATWTTSSGDGVKQVWAKFLDGLQNIRTIGPHSITLDQTLPTVPGTLTPTLSCSGTNRTVSLSWGASTDANLVGYRVYRSIDNGPYEVVVTTSSLTASDTHSKGLDSVRFQVVAYDKAGNEGAPTNEIALAKNKCS